MKIKIKAEAFATLTEIEKFIERKNTPGSGKKFTIFFLNFIKKTLTTFNNHAICKYPEFKSMNWRYFFYNDWVIAYAVEYDRTEVKLIIHGSLLNY